MKQLFSTVIISLFILFLAGCDKDESISIPTGDINLAGSTPGNDAVLRMLDLHPDTVDFLRWEVSLDTVAENSGTFHIHVNYGLAKQNTTDFVNSGEHKTASGTFVKTILPHAQLPIYRLFDTTSRVDISIVQLSFNLFHILNIEQSPMPGNGGWSYTLNNRNPVSGTSLLPRLITNPFLYNFASSQYTFEGRTPCDPLASFYDLQPEGECFKLKWRLILYRDPVAQSPTTYTLRYIHREPVDIDGTWSVFEGLAPNEGVQIINLHPADGTRTRSILVGDNNVLYFLDEDQVMMVGNNDYSFTLNRVD